ncbi:MAG: TlpA disulfide reductase family protein [Planctomycetota bacterium]
MRRLLAAAALAVVTSAFLAADARAEGHNLTGQPAPEIYVQQGLYTLPTGVTLQSFRGRPVVLKFFFTNCPACRESLPEFERLFRQYGTRAQFIAVAYDNRYAVESMWRRMGYTMPIAIDEYGLTAQRYGITTYPTSYLVGADGVVRSYDVVTGGLIERELARAGVVAPAVAASSAGTASNPSVTPAIGAAPTNLGGPSAPVAAGGGERNVAELGEIPSALTGVADAARQNDYGAVLRIVQKHLDAATDTTEVVQAANRIEAIAIQRSERRKAKIQERWKLGDQIGAYDQIGVMIEDFRGTSLERSLKEWSERVKADLVARHVIASSR